MRLRVDGSGLVAGAGHAMTDAHAVHELAVAAERVGAGLGEPAVGAGLGAVTEVCGDALRLIALDLEVVGARLRAGARLYDAVESEVVGAGRVRGGG
jgi:hypothetical protein